MSYKHILVTVDPSEDVQLSIDKAVLIAKATDAELSLISTDEVYRVDHHNMIALTPARAKIDKVEAIDHFARLEEIKATIDYPVKNILIGDNSIADQIQSAIREENVDLVVCSHHHDFWHSLFSEAVNLIKTVKVDFLVVSVD